MGRSKSIETRLAMSDAATKRWKRERQKRRTAEAALRRAASRHGEDIVIEDSRAM